MNIFFSLPSDATSLSDVYTNQSVWDELASRNINITLNSSEADATMVISSNLSDSSGENLIVLERVDGCQIVNRKLLSDSRVLKLVKLSHYSDLDVYGLPNCDNRIFTRHLTTEYNKENKPLLPEADMKLCLGMSFLHYHRHFIHEEVAANATLMKHRENDIFFAGTTQYGPEANNSSSGELITNHRKTLVDELRGLSFGRSVVEPNRAFRGKEYMNLLQSSKLTFSPWGWGESCYRDYEALMHGCEVIKPSTYKMASNPDIYNDKFMTFCKPDWSDLEKVVEERLDTWQSRADQREENKRYILQEMSVNSRADIIENILRGALEGHQDVAA